VNGIDGLMTMLNPKGCGLLGLAVIAQAASDLSLSEPDSYKTTNNNRLKKDAFEFCTERFGDDLWWALTGIEPEWLAGRAMEIWQKQEPKQMGGCWKQNMRKR